MGAEKTPRAYRVKQWHKRFTDCTEQFGKDHHAQENAQELINIDSLNGQLQNDLIVHHVDHPNRDVQIQNSSTATLKLNPQ